MKLFNLFKKETKTNTSKIEALNKKQLQKVVGGVDETIPTPEPDDSRGGRTRSNHANE